MLSDGMGYDDVVAGIVMVLRLIERNTCIGESRITTQGQELYAIVLLYGSEHLFSRLPMLRKKALVVKMNN